MKSFLRNIASPFLLIYDIFYILIGGTWILLKDWWIEFRSDLKYDRALRKMYRNANRKIKEATMLCRSEGRQYYVLPDPNRRGDFYCISPAQKDFLVKEKRIGRRFDGLFLIKNSIFIASPNGKHTKREIKASKEWLLGKK